MTLRSIIVPLVLGAGLSPACSEKGPAAQTASSQADSTSWLRGTTNQRFALVAKHLRGFDLAMAEVGYRFTELYWAGSDRNWGYAEYQLGKIETAVANGLERRPARAASARMLSGAVTSVRAAITRRDGAAMDVALTTLTATCNACHRAERVPFITVTPPRVRSSPIQLSPSPGPAEGPRP